MYFKRTALTTQTHYPCARALFPSEMPVDKDTKLYQASLALPVSEHLGFDSPGQSMDFFRSI